MRQGMTGRPQGVVPPTAHSDFGLSRCAVDIGRMRVANGTFLWGQFDINGRSWQREGQQE